jgi:ElaB/YqjD/DUF883 family membrane-anchored ribosome-binding protein
LARDLEAEIDELKALLGTMKTELSSAAETAKAKSRQALDAAGDVVERSAQEVADGARQAASHVREYPVTTASIFVAGLVAGVLLAALVPVARDTSHRRGWF